MPVQQNDAWITRSYADGRLLDQLRETFDATGAAYLPGLLSPGAHEQLTTAAAELRAAMRRRAFVMPRYGTPRVMSVLGASALAKAFPAIRELYASSLGLVERLVTGPVFACTHREEYAVMNRLEGRCATHGWHFDNGTYALTFVLEAPPPGAGGVVEYVGCWSDVCRAHGIAADTPVDAAVEALRTLGVVQTLSLAARDAYLLRADEYLHRVTPLLQPDARRVVLNLSFQNAPSVDYDGTADLLYG